jgi:16S rRNA (guanine(966)-N(2))-methyltransferase RsmD
VRIISGKYKGKRIQAPKNLPVRPTTDFAKEALFNILNNLTDIENAAALDLFCGTGNITYELLSRGANPITCVDIHFKNLQFVRKTLSELKETSNVLVIRNDVFKFINSTKQTFDIIFADPPYDLTNINEIPILIFKNQLLNPNGYLIVEHGKNTDLSKISNFMEQRKYGNVNFSIFSNKN